VTRYENGVEPADRASCGPSVEARMSPSSQRPSARRLSSGCWLIPSPERTHPTPRPT
jgi:hypothetical protein